MLTAPWQVSWCAFKLLKATVYLQTPSTTQEKYMRSTTGRQTTSTAGNVSVSLNRLPHQKPSTCSSSSHLGHLNRVSNPRIARGYGDHITFSTLLHRCSNSKNLKRSGKLMHFTQLPKAGERS